MSSSNQTNGTTKDSNWNTTKIRTMKIKTKRGEEPQDVTRVTITIGNNTFYLTESVDGKLNINKTTTDGENELLMVNPRSGNEIELL